MLPKISIITPSYNQGQFLEDTILSVLGQHYPNLEYGIMDGGSTDNSVEIIKKYADKINFWVSEKDGGQAAAINEGFSKCSGEIFMWLNSDDMLMPNVLQYVAQQFMEKGGGIFYGNCIHFEEQSQGKLLSRGSYVNRADQGISLGLIDYIIQPSSFWSATIWKKNGVLDASLHFGFDWEWFLRAEKRNIPFYSLSKPLSLYRIHDDHKSGVGGKARQEELHRIYIKYAPKYAELYKLICEERFLSRNSFKKVVKIFSPFITSEKRAYKILKKIKPRKYRAYSVNEMFYAHFMA